MSRLRILHVFRAPVGGLFRHVLDAVRGQAARGHEVGIFCDSSTGGPAAEKALAAAASDLALGVTRVPMRRLPHILDAAAIAALTRLCGRTKPDVLHGHGSKGGAYARMVVSPARDRTTIRAYTPHGGSFNYRPGSLVHTAYMRAERLFGLRTDVFLFESEYVRDRFAAFVGPTDRLVRVVHNGLSEAEFEPIEAMPDPFDLVYIGELRDAKGVDTLIDAIGIVRREHQLRLTLLAIGSGPDEGALKARAQSAGIWDSVAFVPPQPVRTAFARGRIMVVPSKAESLPYVILEAAAAAQPLVSTNVGGIGEIFGPYSDELIRPGDPTLLAARILSATAEPEARRAARAAGLQRHVRSRFNMDRMIDEGLEGYGEARRRRGIAS